MKPAVAARAMTLLVSALLAACATPQLGRIGPGEEVAIVAADREAASAPFGISNKAIGQDAGSGALAGMTALGLTGLTCGSLAVVCVPLAALVGAGVGAAGGAVVGIAGSLHPDSSRQLRDRLDSYRAANDPPQRLVQSIAEEAKGHWTPAPAGSATTVIVRLEEVALHAMPRDHIALWMRATVTVRRKGATQATDSDTKTYDYLGPASDARLWIEDRNDFVAYSFSHAYGHIAQGVFADLAR